MEGGIAMNSCPKVVCKKCGQIGHFKKYCKKATIGTGKTFLKIKSLWLKKLKYKPSIFYEFKKSEESDKTFSMEPIQGSQRSEFLQEQVINLRENLTQKQMELEKIKIEMQAYKENYETERIENLKRYLMVIENEKLLEAEFSKSQIQIKQYQEKYDNECASHQSDLQMMTLYSSRLEKELQKYQLQSKELQEKFEKEFADNLKLSVSSNRLKKELKNSQLQNVEWQEKYEKEVAANQKLILDSLKSN